ncbi:MAG: divalent-cation tolerance protein CutA [Verrucomicrobia bacterium]|nr:divalent-cation tolerance protein CutA [Verrucomicrobiota bacterium]
MTETILVMCTVGNIDEGRSICRGLVENKLVACASLFPLVESYFLWDGLLEETPEVKIFLKTKAALYPLVERFIKEHHSYQVPEILSFKVEAGNLEYLKWIRETV